MPAGLRMRPVLAVAGAYALLVAVLIGLRPLWLDEIIQVLDSRRATAPEAAQQVRYSPGNAPLGTLVEHWTFQAAGSSARTARLPAAVFGVGCVLLTGLIALTLRLPRPWLAAAAFGVLPLALRYAAEARGYSQALFFSLAATLLFLRLARRPGPAPAVLYALALMAAVYTQPYAALVAGAHILWAVLDRRGNVALYAAGATAAAVLTFLPWYLPVRGTWAASVASGGLHLTASWKTPLMLFREISGAGYWGSGLLAILCVLGALRLRAKRPALAFLLLLIVVPAAGVLAADAVFDYFIAARQMLWILPPAAILASAARRPSAVFFAVLLLAVCVWKNAAYFSSRAEDWDAAARALAAETRSGACLVLADPGSLVYLRLFAPELGRAPCDSSVVVAAITPHTSRTAGAELLKSLAAQGYSERAVQHTGGATVVLMKR
jgi:hypothetical protein